jgi:hypothetical protein
MVTLQAAEQTATQEMAWSVCRNVNPRAGPSCQGCRATEEGSNCWDMAISPCCDRDRSGCGTCPVHAMAMKALSQGRRARIVMQDGTTVEGLVAVRRGQRLSDLFNDETRPFVPMTEAIVSPPAGPAAQAPTSRCVVFVATRAAALIFPEDEQAAAEVAPA